MNSVNEMYYDNYMNVNDIVDTKEDASLTSVSDGFKRGNIFKNIYWPYKKQTYNFIPKNSRQKLLLDIMENCFYAHELNLYLDNFPNDKDKIKLFNKYSEKSNNLIKEYSKKYEPLTLSDNLEVVPFGWEESPWPWEGV